MAELVVYGIPQSTYVRSVRMACVEKGVAYTLDPQMPHSETINALHPYGKIPALKHGDFTLYETSAILRDIDEAFDGPSLQPKDAKGRARMEQWISTINAYCDGPMIRRLVMQYYFPSGGKPDRAIIDAASVEVNKDIALIDAAVSPGPYLLGADISLADLLLAPILFYVAQVPEGQAALTASKNMARSSAAMRARKSFQDTMPPAPPKKD
jgi:glutathione S-transferase